MVNPEHMEVVLNGATTIKEWRKTHPSENL